MRRRSAEPVRRSNAAFASLALAAACGLADGQRVQLPPAGPAATGADVWGAPAAPTFSAPPALPAPSFDPYSGGLASPAPLGPSYGGPPPAALPYSYTPAPAAGQAFGQAPLSASPYGVAPQAPAPSYDPLAPPAPIGLAPEGGGLGWQPGAYGFQQDDGTLTRFRRFFARLRGEHTLLLGDNSRDALELNRTEIAATFAWPVGGQLDTPLLITPGFAFNWFDGPEFDPTDVPRGPDLPPRAYDAYVDFAWHPRFNNEVGAELGFRTGVWTDFEELNGDTLRFLGRGLGVVTITPQFDLLLGVVYLDRVRVKLLPAGGVRWRPSPEWDLYLVFPNPKVRRRLRSTGSADWWWYAAGEYGGGSWTVERAGLGDRIDYNDLRFSLGLEWQTPTQARGHLEVGYVFDRELLFGETGQPNRAKLDDAIMFRVGVGF